MVRTPTERMRDWRRDNPEKAKLLRRRTTLSNYGLTPEDYLTLLDAQGGKCAVCYSTLVRGGLHPDIDHNHSTGEVRGILCRTCNRALGLFRDDAEVLRRAAAYLEGGI